MGKSPRRKLFCRICQSSFFSYKNYSFDKSSQKSHRNKSGFCKSEQARLKKEHEEAGNNYDLNFDVDEEMANEDIVDGEDNEDENESSSIQIGEDVDGTEIRDNIESDSIDEIVDEDDYNADNNLEDEDVISAADSDDSYDRDRRLENVEYDDRLLQEALCKAPEEEKDEDELLDFQVAEAKRNPQDVSYWNNPTVDLIGKFIKKRFGTFGVFRGEIKSWKSPYFKVLYTDGDEEELSLPQILSFLDLDQFQSVDDMDVSDELEQDDIGSDLGDGFSEHSGEEVNSEADSKSSASIVSATVLTKEQCIPNDVLKIQQLVLSQLYDQTSSPIRFNKVNNEKEVNKVAALQILKFCEERHMSRVEAEEYLKSTHHLIEAVTLNNFDMVRSYKTLKRVFLWSLDKKIPLSYAELKLPSPFFGQFRTRSNNPLPSIKAAYIPLEVTIALLLLKLDPEDVIDNFAPEYWTGINNEGEESVQRIYTNWVSGKYAVDIQRLYRDSLDTVHTPLLLCFSIHIDESVMNSGQSRSTTPVSICLQNGRNKNFQNLVGFVPDQNSTSPEVLDGLLEGIGINQTGRNYILQLASRQREWDYLSQVFTPFMKRQEQSNGFDVQIGTGENKKFFRIFVVFTNFQADSPQFHALTGVSNKSCHLCMCRNFANFRLNDCDCNGRNGSINEQEEPRDIFKQFSAGAVHMKTMAAFLNKAEGSNNRAAQSERVRIKNNLKSLNARSGVNRVFSIFKVLLHEGLNVIFIYIYGFADSFLCFVGVGNMLRIFGSDILHTWVLGFVEACVGFTLQIIKYVGYGNVDTGYSQSPKRLVEILKKFPAYNSLQPVNRHIIFQDIWEMCLASSSKKITNPLNTTGIIKMREKIKLLSALLQLFFALASKDLLPSNTNWSRDNGFEKPYFSPQQVLINALNAVLEVHWHFKAGSLTENQLVTLQMLICNAQAHMLILDVVRKRLVQKAISTKDKFEDIPIQKISLMSNVKFELITHMVQAMRESGCDNNARDTEQGEKFMKICKLLFADTTRRYHTVLKEMMTKFLHLEYMAVAEKGFLDAKIPSMLKLDVSKSHNSSCIIYSHGFRFFKCNSNYKKQVITFKHGGYRTKKDGSNWFVHPLLKLVRYNLFKIICVKSFSFFIL